MNGLFTLPMTGSTAGGNAAIKAISCLAIIKAVVAPLSESAKLLGWLDHVVASAIQGGRCSAGLSSSAPFNAVDGGHIG